MAAVPEEQGSGAAPGQILPGAGATLTRSLPFDPAAARESLAGVPDHAAVFALHGAEAHAQPYIGRTPGLRARLERLLLPSPRHPRRLELAGRVRRIAWRPTGSEFESLQVQFALLEELYGARALERMHLAAPAFIRYLGANPYPRLTVTHRPSRREAAWAFGPFASRTQAERFAEEVLKLFLLRRCTDDLHPDPGHPGCMYSEMKMCLAPCYQGCSDARYAGEAEAVRSFLATRGASRLSELRRRRDEASTALEFEAAAAIHTQVERVQAVQSLAPELVQPLSQLQAVILETAAAPDEVAVFLFADGLLRGPATFSTLGMRIQNERSGSSSLFAHPVALEAVPESGGGGAGPARVARGVLETRWEEALRVLDAPSVATGATVRQAHLALLKRWYYRPEARRTGEIFFPGEGGDWPVKAILRGVGRMAMKAAAAHLPPPSPLSGGEPPLSAG